MNIVEITGVVKEYAWGNPTFIPAFLGKDPDGQPNAELWYGTHPDGMARVVGSGQELNDVLLSDPEHWLGEDHLATFGEQLPLLMKILAIDKPLSIQVHPNKAQAERGWADEEHLRSRLHKDQWNYKDPNQKAEIGYALESVTALSGFRPLNQTIGWFTTLIPTSLKKYFSILTEDGEEDVLLRRFFEVLYSLEKSELQAVLDELFLSLDQSDLPLHTPDGSFLQERGVVEHCKALYTLDPGLLAPFFLNVVHLKAGQALFITPGVLHAYMKGVVLEVMSASDNVLRGGLTPKKVDVAELLKIVDVHGKNVELVEKLTGRSGRIHLLTPTEEFHLMVLPAGSYAIDERLSMELLLQGEGTTIFTGGGQSKTLKKGSCHIVAAGLGEYHLDVEGTLYIADVPR